MTLAQIAIAANRDLVAEDIEVDLLLYFTAVASELSFTKAAAALGIDQSWLSHKIRQLEAKLEVDLFIRNTRHVQLTDAGRSLLEPAMRLQRVAQETRKVAMMLRDGVDGQIRLGALPFSFRDARRAELLERFAERNPFVQLTVVNGASPTLLEKVRRGDLDAAIISAPFDHTGLDSMLLGLEDYQLVIPSEHPLAEMAQISFDDLRGQRIVMPLEKFSPGAFQAYYQPFVDAGAVQVAPPEFQAPVDYSLRWRLPVICRVGAAEACLAGGFVARPLPGEPVRCEKFIVRAQGAEGPALKSLWETASLLSAP